MVEEDLHKDMVKNMVEVEDVVVCHQWEDNLVAVSEENVEIMEVEVAHQEDLKENMVEEVILWKWEVYLIEMVHHIEEVPCILET